jgi:aminoglycoside phosphotransferase family enzyme
VCLEPPVVIDCLEFDRRLRLRDPSDELSRLSGDLAVIGAPELGTLFLETYEQLTGDRPAPSVLSFYGRNAALVKARIAVWRLAQGSGNQTGLLARIHTSFRMAEVGRRANPHGVGLPTMSPSR